MITINPVAFTVFGHGITWYGIIIAGGVLLSILLACHRGKYYNVSTDTVTDFAIITIPSAIVGARLYYVIFKWQDFSGDFLSIFKIWTGGLAVYGGIIAAVIAAYFVSRHKKMNPLTIYDIAMPALALGQAIGRWGNFVNQEAFGSVVTDPSLQFFPYAVYIQSQGAWHMATFFYESMACFAIVIILSLLTRRLVSRPGSIALGYGFLYGIARFFIEGLRTDSLYIGSFRVSQALSLLLVIFCGVMLYLQWRKKRTEENVEVDPRLVMRRPDHGEEELEQEVDDPTVFTDPADIADLEALDGGPSGEEESEDETNA